MKRNWYHVTWIDRRVTDVKAESEEDAWRRAQGMDKDKTILASERKQVRRVRRPCEWGLARSARLGR